MKFIYGRRIRKFDLYHPYVLPTVLLFGFVFSILWALVVFGGQTVGAKDTRIVRVKIGNEEEMVVPTRSRNVGQLIESLDIEVLPTDKVEPAEETPIIQDNELIRVYRSRPIIVREGDKSTELVSAEQDPVTVAKQAGIEIDDKDLVVRRPYEDSLIGGLIAERYDVFRAIPLTANVYGTLVNYKTQAKTIDEFLKEMDIQLKEGETTQPEDRSQAITPNMLISVNLPGKKTVAVTEQFNFKVETKNDPKLQAGQSRLEREGVKGERAVIYEVSYEGDIEVSRRQIQTVVIREPVNEIRIKGTLAAATYSVSGDRASLMLAAGISADQHASADYIISRESGWRPGAVSPNNCIGLGQRCPNGGRNALAIACPDWQNDPVCQLRHFSAYANGRYGSWNGAYSAWQAQHWW